ncbi:MAG: hypothetical protein JW955_06285 [Sedimentisphaerales bacterium]|nr:hypothetical protein [Sedimentisphaerales bacterium]
MSRKQLWHTMPAFLKSVLGTLLEPVPSAWLFGKRFRDASRHALEAQWWPAQRSQEYELEALRAILRLAYENTVFYRREFDDLGFSPDDLRSLAEMRRLPTIDRQAVIKHAQDMLTCSSNAPDVNFVSTSGTSGTPLHFYINASISGTEYAFLTASWKRVGYDIDDPMGVLRGRLVRANRHGLYHEYDPILRSHYYSSFHLSDKDMARYLEHVASIGPCFLHVYPSTVAVLARFIQRSHKQAPKNIRGIIAESEIVYPDQRRMVEEVFGCRYFSCYGLSEKVVLAAECEHSTDYHVWPTYGHFELLDEAGNPVTTPGQRGEIVGTGFMNTVMPFIRYRTGDWATYVGERCEACGREHTIIRDIRGHRTQEMLIAAGGSEIPWTALNMHDDTFIRVRQFQFMQDAPGRAVLRIVPAGGFGDADRNRIHRNLGRKLNGQLSFTIALVDAIPLSARGKTIYVDQRIKSDAPGCGCLGECSSGTDGGKVRDD